MKKKYVSSDTYNKQKILKNLYLNEINKRINQKIKDGISDESEECLIDDLD